MPEIDHSEIDATLGLGDYLQVAAEVLGVVVDQRHEIFQQLTQRPVACEFSDDNQQAWAAARQDPEWLDLAPFAGVATDHVPETSAFVGIQRFQIDDAEQLEKRLRHVVQPFETTGRGSDQHDLRFRLQRLAKPPSEVVVDVFAQGLQVLDHEDKRLVEPIRCLHDGGMRTLLDVRVVPPTAQIGMRRQ